RAGFVVVDVETTGLSADSDAIIEIGAVRVEALHATSRFETLVRRPGPGRRGGLRRGAPRACAARPPRTRELRALARRGAGRAVGGAQRALRQRFPAPRPRGPRRARF